MEAKSSSKVGEKKKKEEEEEETEERFGKMIRGALASSLASVGSGVLRHCRVAPASATLHRRRFSEPSSSLLDKAVVADRVLALLQRLHKIEPSKVSMSTHFQKDLGLDCLDTVELVMALEEEFSIEIPDTEAEKISTCEQAILFIASQPKAK